MSKVKRVFGVGGFNKTGKGFNTPQQVSQVLNILKQNGINELDSARLYGAGTSDELLGETPEFKTFIVSTKANPFQGTLTREAIITQCEQSLKAMNRSCVDIFYLHAPDRTVPFEEQVGAVNELYKRGSLKKFGLSNFTANEVEEIYKLCKKYNYVLPSVYQGNYNPIARKNEQELFPLLRKLGMSFYAYSPLAGGFLIKTAEQIKNGPANGRFDASTPGGQVFTSLYCKETIFSAVETFQRNCKKHGIKPSEACYSWLLNHSQLKEGDAILLGASNMDQFLENVHDSKGIKLNANMIRVLEDLWKAVESEAPNYHF